MRGDSILGPILEGRMEGKKKGGTAENDVIGQDDESLTSWQMASLDAQTCLGRQRTKRKKKLHIPFT